MNELRQPRHNRNAFVATTDSTRPDWECDCLSNGRSSSRDWAAEQIAVIRRRISQRRALAGPTVTIREAVDSTVADSPSRRANIEDRYEEAERWDGMA